MASPDDSFGPAVAQIPAGSDICHRGCAYKVLQLFNPLSPHDAVKHHFTSLKTHLIFLQQRVLKRKFP